MDRAYSHPDVDQVAIYYACLGDVDAARAPIQAALLVVADRIDRGLVSALPPSVISALVREFAADLTQEPSITPTETEPTHVIV